MEKQNMNELINKAKSSNQSKTIQKIVPITTKETEEIQFSFYIEKSLLKKLTASLCFINAFAFRTSFDSSKDSPVFSGILSVMVCSALSIESVLICSRF